MGRSLRSFAPSRNFPTGLCTPPKRRYSPNVPYGDAASVPTIWTDAAHESYWTGQGLLADTEVLTPAEASFGFSRCSVVFLRTTPSGVREDSMVTHLDWAHIDAGVCVPLSAVEMGEVEAALNAFFPAIATAWPNTHTASQYVWHRYAPIDSRPGPAVRTAAGYGLLGGPATRLPDQDAITTTYHTASRRHWGRSYWPMNSTVNLEDRKSVGEGKSEDLG